MGIGGNSDTLDKQTRYFANLANFVALMGGAIKKNQFISGDMAQLMSNLYLGHAIVWCEKHEPTSKILYHYCLNRICSENQLLINRIISNYPSNLRLFLRPMTFNPSCDTYDSKRELIKEVDSNPEILEKISENIYCETGILDELERLNKISPHSDEYKKLYNKIIQVGEYGN